MNDNIKIILLLVSISLSLISPPLVKGETPILDIIRNYSCPDANIWKETIYLNVTYDDGSNETKIIENTLNCPGGCVDDGGQYGAICKGYENECISAPLPYMGFGTNFTLGLGIMLMLVGVGVVSDVIIRKGQQRKEEEIYSI